MKDELVGLRFTSDVFKDKTGSIWLFVEVGPLVYDTGPARTCVRGCLLTYATAHQINHTQRLGLEDHLPPNVSKRREVSAGFKRSMPSAVPDCHRGLHRVTLMADYYWHHT